MPRDNDNNKDGDNRGVASGGNLGWLLIIIAITAVIFVFIYTKNMKVEILASDLQSLLKKSAGGKAGVIEVIDNKGQADEEKFEFKNLQDIVIGRGLITGKVDRRIFTLKQSEKSESDSEDAKKDEESKKKTPVKKEYIQTENWTSVEFETSIGTNMEVVSKYNALLDTAKITYKIREAPGLLESFLPMLVIMGIVLVVVFFMMRRLGGTGSAMAFSRHRGKMYAQEEIGISFRDVAGIDEAVEELQEVVDFLRMPEKYRKLGGRIPKGVLLVGPPGTGKTLLAKAIAGEARVPFFSLSGSDFVEMFVGVGAARVRDMFQQATTKAPCIIFIDELDALGKTRGANPVGGHDEREQTLNALLVEMDGFESNNGVIVLAATNRPETLDPALMRPGRFDRNVLVDRPDIAGREEILKVHVKNVKLDADVELRKVAAITSGFVGADLANLVNEAALLAARNEKNAVGMHEFNDGVERVTAGLEKKQRIIHEDEKQRVAYHESGHALVAHFLPDTDPVHKVSIIPRGIAALGYTMQRPEEDRYLMTKGELESRIKVLVAGTIAEEMTFEDISTGAQNDLERATDIARSMVMDFGMSSLGRVTYRKRNRADFLEGAGGESARLHSEETTREIDQEVRRIIDEAISSTREMLESRRAELEELAKRLIEIESVGADELRRIMGK